MALIRHEAAIHRAPRSPAIRAAQQTHARCVVTDVLGVEGVALRHDTAAGIENAAHLRLLRLPGRAAVEADKTALAALTHDAVGRLTGDVPTIPEREEDRLRAQGADAHSDFGDIRQG